MGVIFIFWASNLRYIWGEKENQDEFVSLIEKLILRANESFKDIDKKLKKFKNPEISAPLTNEELERLRKKVLEY